ncbi:MAG: PTS sugar transporter subunit IIA [Treponema sp.]|jgi:PTS system nitrogen regulatory IIA component|nr:PTS sugar transporter subunit IIA [Treponema sp.]
MIEKYEHSQRNSLSYLVEQGGIHYALPGETITEVLSNLLDCIPSHLVEHKKRLIEAILEREALMSTGIGRGIALPHPRNPLIDDEEKRCVVIAFLKNGINWKAPDGKPVHTVILIISSSAKNHLQTLSHFNFLCQEEKFYWLLERHAAREEIIAAIREAELKWQEI